MGGAREILLTSAYQTKKMDLLHPQLTLQWRKRLEVADKRIRHDPNVPMIVCPVPSGEVYVCVDHDWGTSLFRISSDLSSWKLLDKSYDNLYSYAFTAYRGKLLKLGGWTVSCERESISNGVLVSDYDDGESWMGMIIPTLTSRRFSATAFSTKNPEFLIILGGMESLSVPRKRIATVEVLVDSGDHKQWASLKPLPPKFVNHGLPWQPVEHNGNMLFGHFFCKLEELKAECGKVAALCRTGIEHGTSGADVASSFLIDLWRHFTILPLWNVLKRMLSYKQQLLGFTRKEDGEIMTFSPFDNNSWIKIGTAPDGPPVCVFTHSTTGEVVALTSQRGQILSVETATMSTKGISKQIFILLN